MPSRESPMPSRESPMPSRESPMPSRESQHIGDGSQRKPPYFGEAFAPSARKGSARKGSFGEALDAREKFLAWFLKDPDTNFVDISFFSGWIEDQEEGMAGATLDVPEPVFDAMLERAAKHRGYFGHQRDIFETVTRDAVLHQWESTNAQNPGPPLMNARVIAKQLHESRPFDGTPLLVRTYQRSMHPFSAFPCDAPVHSKKKIRRLELRVHKDARLVFETLLSESKDVPPRVVRRVRLEIEKKGSSVPHDLQRTIENTVQVVLMGMAPQGRGVQLERTFSLSAS